MRRPISVLTLACAATIACRASPIPALDPATFPFAIDTARSTVVREGVVHRFLYSPAGPWAIHVLDARADRCWSLAALKSSGGAVGRELTSTLIQGAAASHDVAGGVNADFFLFTPPGVPVGLLVADGSLIAGPIAQPAVAADSAGRVHIGRFDARGYVAFDGKRLALSGWNRDVPDGLSLFDAAWGSATDTASGIVEIVVGGTPAYRVEAIDTATAGVPIPAHGAVIRMGRRADPALRGTLDRLTRGTAVAMSVRLTPFHPRDAVGGRPILLQNGAVAARLDSVGRTGFAGSRHPRTAAGITRDGKRILLVTVDGRQAPYSDGMTLPELADLMRALGASEAVNLDGGGSTTMVLADSATPAGFRVANRPSDRQGERAVGDAVALVRRCGR